MQGSATALKAAPKLHNHTRLKKQWYTKYTYIVHIKTYTHTKLTEENNDFKKFCLKTTWKRKRTKSKKNILKVNNHVHFMNWLKSTLCNVL